MDLVEAKKILIKNGYMLIKEGTGWSPRKAEPDFKQKIDASDVVDALNGTNVMNKRKLIRTINAFNRIKDEDKALAQHRNKTLLNAANYLRTKYDLRCMTADVDGYTGLIVNNTYFILFHDTDEGINSYDSSNDWYGKYSDLECYELLLGHMDFHGGVMSDGILKSGTLDEIGKYLALAF